ncbi:uncharacterized protein LOC126736793 isoform X3 [Anthonomus grandis grandis]|uniref:uncharacterized protein LOC126736793 isoform X3 n=1 Tax=Anthonomus grandis grandis TaxID=2921223 RepID=UPI002165A53B|nr:uncharacterized protein LOC126736793 isoform X3 [Anthonomus grandis grandis]
MTDRLRTSNPYSPLDYQQGSQPRLAARRPHSSDGEISTRKTVIVFMIIAACFALLWPKLFYPLLVKNANNQMKPGPVDKTTGCCDVISEVDLDTIKIMSELCATIIENAENAGPKEIVSQCRKAVLETCGIDISAALQDRISLGHSVKQILEEVRSLNGSLCLKYNFGLSPWKLGVPHRVNIHLDSAIRQERPPHLRPELVHPAFKERGRAIPGTDAFPEKTRKTGPPPRIVDGHPGPIPGMRPTLGGAGHVVPPSKHNNHGISGILLPMYTIGFVIFFVYNIMKLVYKKKQEDYVGAPLYPPCETDEQFHKEVFEANKHYFNRPKDTSKIGDEELDQLRKRLHETELAMERIVNHMAQAPLIMQEEPLKPNGTLPKDEDQGSVTVMAIEATASAESGKKWSRPDSPVLPHPQPVPPKEPTPPPQQIFLEGSLPPQSQLLVADSATEAEKSPEDDSPVVLAGKMTLSVISLDSEDSSGSGKKSDSPEEGRRTSGSNTSDEFVKIDADELEEQINDIIVEAERVAVTEEKRGQAEKEEEEEEEPVRNVEVSDLPITPSLNEKESETNILEEIKNQFNLEDDLMQILKDREPEGKVSLPVTDIIKEFLASEENALDMSAEEKETVPDSAIPETEAKQTADFDEEELPIVEELAQIEKPKIEEQPDVKEEKESEKIEIHDLQQVEKRIIEEQTTGQEFEIEEATGKLDENESICSKQIPQEEIHDSEQPKPTTSDLLLEGPQVKEDTDIETITTTTEEEPDHTNLLLQGLQVKEDTDVETITTTTEEDPDDTKEPLDFEEEVEYVEESEDTDENDEDEELSEGDNEDLNAGGIDVSTGGGVISNMVADNEISDEDEVEDDEEEIEEIIEYVDNTDEEGEEIIEINANEDDRHHHLHQNGDGP